MALFNDGPVSGIEDLQGHDTQLLEVANTEGIDVTRKLALAQEEMSLELRVLLARMSGPVDLGSTTTVPSLDYVVVTPPLKLWHTFRTLELVYRDAYNSQLNDRYAGKRDEYHALAQWAYEKAIQSGIGMSQDPVAQASPPKLEAASGAIADGMYYVAVAWTNGAGEEGAPSLPATITISGSTFQVQAGAAPANARGWNVYAGANPRALVLQNPAVLGLNETWTHPGPVVTGGRTAGTGQSPSYMRPAPRMLQRG
jgi:hypothetical protein